MMDTVLLDQIVVGAAARRSSGFAASSNSSASICWPRFMIFSAEVRI